LAFAGWRVYKGKIVPNELPSVQDNFVKFTLGLPERRAIKILRRNSLLHHPLVPARLSVRGTNASFKFYLDKIEKEMPNSSLALRYLASFETYTCFYRSIQLYWKGCIRPFELNEIEQMKWNILCNPSKYAIALKDLFNGLRANAIASIKRSSNMLDYYYSGMVPEENKLQASACMRALPQFIGDIEPEIQKCITRWTTKSKTCDLQEWNEWITSWTNYYRPTRQPDFYPISLGSGASLEYSRSQGGFKKAVLELFKVSLNKKRQKQFDNEISKIRLALLTDREKLHPFRHNLHLIYACLTTLEPAITHSYECKPGCKTRTLHPPMCILALRERGFKVRLPTMTLSAIVYLAKLLRQVADGYLRSDPRIRNSLEGNYLDSLDFNEFSGNYYRSQDLTVATDHHDREMNRFFYKLINPGVPWWDDAVMVVCNYYTIFPISDLKTYRLLREKFKPFHFDFTLQHYLKDKFFRTMFEKYYQEFEMPEESYTDLHWCNLATKIGVVTCRGQPMGVSTSWPLLPLVSIYSFETSSNKPKITISRTVYPVLNNFDSLNYHKVFEKKQKSQTLTRLVPKNFLAIQTTGDDAVMRLSKSHSERHTAQLEKVGSIVSPTKDFISHRYAIYTEVFYLDGKMLPIWPVGPLLAPKSTRQCTWYSQPKALQSIEGHFKTKINWKWSVFNHIWKFLASNGCPIWAPEILGGLGVKHINNGKSVQRLGKRMNLCIMNTDTDLWRLHPELPIKNLKGEYEVRADSLIDQASVLKQTMQERQRWARDSNKPSNFSKESFLFQKKSLSKESPKLEIPLLVWDQIYRSKDTWNQLFELATEDDEPSTLEFIHRFDIRVPGVTLRAVYSLIADLDEERKQTIQVPWTMYRSFIPNLGLLLPRTQCPYFYFNNKSMELRTTYIF
jgi:hypothetical protein